MSSCLSQNTHQKTINTGHLNEFLNKHKKAVNSWDTFLNCISNGFVTVKDLLIFLIATRSP